MTDQNTPDGSTPGSAIPDITATLFTALAKWMVPGGLVAISIPVTEPADTVDRLEVWSCAPDAEDWTARDSIELGGVSLLDLELATVEAGIVFPLRGQGRGQWRIGEDGTVSHELWDVMLP